jgi:exopolysaccharide biosynthesis polyprenyl glycosylphosphotransferase
MSATTDTYAGRTWALEPARAPARLAGAILWALDGPGARPTRIAADLVNASIAALVAAPAHGHGPRAWLLLFPPAVVALLAARGLYRPRRHPLFLAEIGPVTGAVGLAALTAASAGALSGSPPPTTAAALLWLLATAALALPRAALIAAQRAGRTAGAQTPALIVGSGEVGRRVALRLAAEPAYGLRPVGFLDDDPHPALPPASLPLLGGTGDLAAVARATGARHVLLAFAAERDESLAARVRGAAAEHGLTVGLVPRLFEAMTASTTYEPIGATPVLWLHHHDPAHRAKHALDRIAALALIVTAAPLLAAIALAVKLSSPGPVLFRQRRLGRDGVPFELLKFRSMRGLAEPWRPADGGPGGVEGEDRRTRLGRLLRRTSLDELPQLLNVLRGEMSLVGPRPERPDVAERLTATLDRYAERHRMRPGMTGWAQVHGLRGARSSLADRIAWDNFYVEHWSPGLDLEILALTARAVLRAAE